MGLGAPTSIYLLLYLVTWVIHFFLVAAMLGGAFFVATSLWRSRASSPGLADDLGGTLPLLLGLAITAGVAPLLFVQILYQHAFYTANLLLYVRFLAIIPALLACFYLFYFARTKRARELSTRTRALFMFLAAVFALFVGVSWVELHTLSMAPSVWVQRYAEGVHSNMSGSVALRSMVFLSMVPTLTAVFAAWLSRIFGRDLHTSTGLSVLGCFGAITSLLFAALYARTLGGDVIASLTSGVLAVHVALFVLSGVASAIVWAMIAARGELGALMRRVVVLVTVAWLWSLAVIREGIRAESLDLASLAESHQRAFDTGGQIVFVVFAVVNVAAITWCCRLIWRVWRDARAQR